MSQQKFHSVVIIMLFLVSCNFIDTSNRQPSVARSTWIDEFLENPVCKPPCWENIVPGQTTIQEAKEILLAKGNIKVLSSYEDAFEWEFIPNGEHGKVESDPHSNRVAFINFVLTGVQSLRLEEILKKYPEPSYIDFHPNSHNLKSCYIYIIYESIGLIFVNGNVPCKTWEKDGVYYWKINIQPDLLIEMICLETTERIVEIDRPAEITLWKGYGEYNREYRP
jgi:hypothetical protein